LAKYVILWAAIWAIGIAFDIFGQLWNLIVNSVAASVFTRRNRDPKRQEVIVRRLSLTLPILNQIPYLLRWSLQLAILVALVSPLFDNLARFNGSDVTLRSVFGSIATGHFSAAVSRIAKAVGD
jgi:putative exporter of polyketide antibiotics